jgi:hypothetical protein
VVGEEASDKGGGCQGKEGPDVVVVVKVVGIVLCPVFVLGAFHEVVEEQLRGIGGGEFLVNLRVLCGEE